LSGFFGCHSWEGLSSKDESKTRQNAQPDRARGIFRPQDDSLENASCQFPRSCSQKVVTGAFTIRELPGIASSSHIDKAGALAMAKAMKYSSAEYYDVKVTAFGNTPIASGGFKGKGTDASGKPFDANERWTDTWMKMPDGKWQCIATQATPVKM
jgi:Domain of unknown function (DUF4440)